MATISATVLAFHPRAADAFGLTKTLVLAMGATVAVACVVLWKVESGQPFPRTPALAWLAGLVAAVGLATATSTVRTLSLVGSYTRYDGLATFVFLGLLSAATAVAFAFDPQARRRVLFVIVAAAVVVAVYAILQRLGIDAFDFRDVTGLKPDFPGSTVGNSLFAGSVCGMALPVAAVAATHNRGWARLLDGAAVVVLGAGLWATSSRSGMLGALAGLAVVVLLTPNRWQRLLRRAAAAAVVIVAVFGVIVVWHPGFDRAPGALAQRQVLRTESLTIRGGEWSAAVRVWQHRPLVGTGPDTFANSSPRYRSPDDARRFGLRIADKPHNLFLEYLAATGVIGLLAFVGFIVAVGRTARRSLPDADSIALLAVVTSYLVAATFSFDTPATTPVAFVAAALLMAAAATPGNPAPAPLRLRSTNRVLARVDNSPWFTRVGAAVVVAVVVTFAVAPLRADLAAAQAQRAEGSTAASLAKATRRFDVAIARNPWASTYRAEAGDLAMRWADTVQSQGRRSALRVAVARYQQAVDAEPGNVVFALGLAQAQTNYALATANEEDFLAAAHTWRVTIARDRDDWQLRNAHALALNTWANALNSPTYRRQAATELRAVVAVKPDYMSAWINLARLSIALGDRDTARDAARHALALHPDGGVVDELRAIAD
ncbi:MAG: hypothetical protein QOK28_415 [Actinomycetota bacterium]|jgi:O-antigen ligase